GAVRIGTRPTRFIVSSSIRRKMRRLLVGRLGSDLNRIASVAKETLLRPPALEVSGGGAQDLGAEDPTAEPIRDAEVGGGEEASAVALPVHLVRIRSPVVVARRASPHRQRLNGREVVAAGRLIQEVDDCSILERAAIRSCFDRVTVLSAMFIVWGRGKLA